MWRSWELGEGGGEVRGEKAVGQEYDGWWAGGGRNRVLREEIG